MVASNFLRTGVFGGASLVQPFQLSLQTSLMLRIFFLVGSWIFNLFKALSSDFLCCAKLKAHIVLPAFHPMILWLLVVCEENICSCRSPQTSKIWQTNPSLQRALQEACIVGAEADSARTVLC